MCDKIIAKNSASRKSSDEEIEEWYNEVETDDICLTKSKSGHYHIYFKIWKTCAESNVLLQMHKVKIIVPKDYDSCTGSPGIKFQEIKKEGVKPLGFLKRCNVVFNTRVVRLKRALEIASKNFNELVIELELDTILDEIPDDDDVGPNDDSCLEKRTAGEEHTQDSSSLPSVPKCKIPSFGLNQYQRIAAFTCRPTGGDNTDCQTVSVPIVERDQDLPGLAVESVQGVQGVPEADIEKEDDVSEAMSPMEEHPSPEKALTSQQWVFRCLVVLMLAVLTVVLSRG